MTRTTISRLTSLLAAVALAACGSGSSGPGGPGSVGGPGPAAALAITASPTQPVTAGEPFTATVEVRDARGNLVTAGLEQISLTLQGGDPAAALGGTTSAQSVLGEAAFADLTVERAADGYRLVASAPGLADASSGEFRIVAAAAAPGSSAVAAAAATQTAGQDVAITATVLDLFGNPVEGATVAFATAASDATFVQPSPTDPSGVATGSVRSTRAEAVTVRGSIGGGPDFAGTATVTFEPGAPSAVASTLAASPTAVDADGTSAISLTATVKDEHGNPVPGATVTLASSGDASFVQPGPTDASGVALGAIRSTAVGQQTVTALAGAAEVAATVEFLTLDPDGDGVPKGDDAFPDDPTRFGAWSTVLLPGLGGAFASATAVNASGLVVGLSEDGSGLLTGAAWTVSGGAAAPATALLPLAGNAYSAAYAVDASGAAVGESARGASEYVAVRWAPGAATPTELGLTGFSSPAAAYGISDGRIVGEAARGGATAAVLWADAGASPVELASLGGDRSAAYAVAGPLVVGESTLAGPGGASRGAAWTLDGSGSPGPALALAPLAGHVSSIALGVDAGGRIVGESESGSGEVHAVYWTLAAPDAPVDLGPGSAQGVNARGRIAGHGGQPVGPIVWDARSPGLLEGVLEDPFLFSQAYGLNGADVVVGLLDGGAFAAVPVSP